MKEAIELLEKHRRFEILIAESHEATCDYMESLEHWTNVVHLDYAISILKKSERWA